jgi:multiple sugar transport system permease protein
MNKRLVKVKLNAQKRELLAGIAFISPWILGFLFFQLYPILRALYLSFTNFAMVKPPVWIGLDNYALLFTKDKNFFLSLKNTLYMAVIGVPIQLVFAFICALLLNAKIKGQSFFRTIYILPTIMPAVATAILWKWIFNPQIGMVNTLLSYIGIDGPTWFADPAWSKPSLIIMLCWMVGSTTIIYLAGLQDVPVELYESAEIEGANGIQKLSFITIPLISPITLFNLITGLIYAFQMFTEPFTISGGTDAISLGRPQGSLLLYSLYLYQNAFMFTRMGKACAMAWILFVIILIVTLFTLGFGRRWTHYEVR